MSFVLFGAGHRRDLHSFPTRRSSDLVVSKACAPLFAQPACREAHASFDAPPAEARMATLDRKSTRLNSSHLGISYAVFCLKKKRHTPELLRARRFRTLCEGPQEPHRR